MSNEIKYHTLNDLIRREDAIHSLIVHRNMYCRNQSEYDRLGAREQAAADAITEDIMRLHRVKAVVHAGNNPMGVAITGIEMPENCLKCCLCREWYTNANGLHVVCQLAGSFLHKDTPVDYLHHGKRPGICPLREL